MLHRLLRAGRDPSEYRRVSTVLRITKGAGSLVLLTVCWLFGWGTLPVVWLFLIGSLIDIIRHNSVLMSLLR